jgi:hypothetical protein
MPVQDFVDLVQPVVETKSLELTKPREAELVVGAAD